MSIVVAAAVVWGGYQFYAPLRGRHALEERVKRGRDVEAATQLSKLYLGDVLRHCDDWPRSRQILARSREILLPYADAGDTNAMMELAYNYRDAVCEVIPGDRERSNELIDKAADLGDVRAMSELYMRYFAVRGDRATVEEANAKGLVWFIKVADAGGVGAQAGLGERYMLGIGGVPQDDNKAREYLEKASDAGEVSAKRDLGVLHAYGTESWAYRSLGVQLLIEAAEHGDHNAPYDLMHIYFEGTVAPKNYAEARRWGKMAVRYAPAAQLLMARLYFEGKGGERDLSEAYAWASIAVASGAVGDAPSFRDQVESELSTSDREKGKALATTYAEGLQTL